MLRTLFGILCLVGSLVMTPVQADNTTALCANMSNMAEDIMTFRQQGKSMQIQMEAADKVYGDSAAHNLVRNLIRIAYQEPLWRTQSSKLTAVQEFRDQMTFACYEKFSD